MQLIVVTNPTPVANEAEIINALFDEGLARLHLRKPNYNETDLMQLIEKIEMKNYSNISFHHQHSVALKNGFKRIHFTEAKREQLTVEELEILRANDCTLSTSIHSLSEAEKLSDNFGYVFYGPVFESISKQGYKPQTKELIALEQNKNRTPGIIAIGGIDATKLDTLKLANYDGAALLGTIWGDTNKSISNFKLCLKNANTL